MMCSTTSNSVWRVDQVVKWAVENSTWVHTGFYSKKLRQFFSEQTVLQTFTSNTLSKMTLRLPFLDTHISYWEHHHMAHRYHSFCQRWFHRPISQCNLHWTDTNLTCTTMCLLPHCKFTLRSQRPYCHACHPDSDRYTSSLKSGRRVVSRLSSRTGSHRASEARKPPGPPLLLLPRLLCRQHRPGPARPSS